MDFDKTLSVASLLEEIRNKSDCCLKYNEKTRALIDKMSQSTRATHPSTQIGDHENPSKINNEDLGSKVYEKTDYLENMLVEKMQENANLKSLNERLLRNSREKVHKIKELSRIVSMQNQLNSKSREVFTFKDKVGKCNVEIQKLKKQLDIETKRLRTEKSRTIRLRRCNTSLDVRKKLGEVAKKPQSAKKATEHGEVAKLSVTEIDKIFIEKTLVMISLSEEPNIHDETLDEPEYLDSGTDEDETF